MFRQLGTWFAADVKDTAGDVARKLGLSRRREQQVPSWGAPDTKDRNHSRIAGYHELASAGEADGPIDNRTWSDLHLEKVFAQVDRCVSSPGEQMLYHLLRSPTFSQSELEERDRAATKLAESAELRRAILHALVPLRTYDAYFLPNLFQPGLPGKPRLWFAFPALTISAFALLLLLVFQPAVALAGLLVVAAINLTVQYRYHRKIQSVTVPLTMLRRLLAAARSVAALDDDVLGGRLRSLRDQVHDVQALDRAARYVAIERRWDDLVGGLYAYLNMIFLLDVNAFVFSVDSVVRHRKEIAGIFETLGFLDAMISIGSWRAGLTEWCRPSFTERAHQLELHNARHPLIEDAVGNDLTVAGRNILITGSNMAGKTTFIRAVALNAILAQTLYTCVAASWRGPLVRVRSMIGRGDDLERGQSYFAVELELTLALVRAAESETQHLFVLDEIFRGTNTIERVAAARSVLQRLASTDHVVLAATHDLELLPLLDRRWEFHHFRESVDAGQLRFDYHLRPGPTSTHNAIRMMEVYGFPEDVVANARRTAAGLEQSLASRGPDVAADSAD